MKKTFFFLFFSFFSLFSPFFHFFIFIFYFLFFYFFILRWNDWFSRDFLFRKIVYLSFCSLSLSLSLFALLQRKKNDKCLLSQQIYKKKSQFQFQFFFNFWCEKKTKK